MCSASPQAPGHGRRFAGKPAWPHAASRRVATARRCAGERVAQIFRNARFVRAPAPAEKLLMGGAKLQRSGFRVQTGVFGRQRVTGLKSLQPGRLRFGGGQVFVRR